MTSLVSPEWTSNQVIYLTGGTEGNDLAKCLKKYNVYSLIQNNIKIRPSDCKSLKDIGFGNRIITPYGRGKAENTVVRVNKALEDGHYVVGCISLIEKHENYAVYPTQIKNRFQITFHGSKEPFSVPSGDELKRFMERNISFLNSRDFKRVYENLGSVWFQVTNGPVKRDEMSDLAIKLYEKIDDIKDPFGATLDPRVVSFVRSVVMNEAFNEDPHLYVKTWFESPKSKKYHPDNFKLEGMSIIQNFLKTVTTG